MKIGLVRRGFSATGGAEAYLLRLAGGLSKAGHEPVLVTTRDWPEGRWPHSGIVRVPGRTPTQFAAGVARANLGVDVTFSLDRVPGCDVFRAGDGVHAAWLQRRAAFEPAWKPLLRRFNPKHGALMALEREVFRTTRRVVANSRLVAREIRHWHGVPAENITIVQNGIGVAFSPMPREEARAKFGVTGFCAVFVGTGWERKGLRTAIEAVESVDGAVLLVAGRGRTDSYASPFARFLGPTRELGAVLSAADVFVLPTIYDPFSNACLEALAAGLPVLTTTANGCSEILSPGMHGDVFEPGDTATLTALLRAWRQRSPGASAAACRALAAEFSLERNVSATLGVLEEACGRDR